MLDKLFAYTCALISFFLRLNDCLSAFRIYRLDSMRRLFRVYSSSFLAGLGIIAPILLSIFALGRPYDSVPDQDLLWLSEALRLFRNAPPTYIDHPGSYWTLSYLFNLKLLSFKGVLSFVSARPGVPVSVVDATTLIYLARIEQGLLCGALVGSFWLSLRLFGVRGRLSGLMSLIYGTSAGILWETVQIRNESTSLLFLFLYIIFSLVAASVRSRSRAACRALSVAAVAAFIFAIYCKIQVLILAVLVIPLVVVRLINSRRVESVDFSAKHVCVDILFSTTVCILGWIAVTSNWVFAPNPPFFHRLTHFNLLFWLYINLGLSIGLGICTSGSICSRSNGLVLARSSFTVVFVEILFARIIFHPAWSAQVFLSPSSFLGFGTLEEPNVLYNAQIYLRQAFPGSPEISAGALCLLFILIVIRLFFKRDARTLLAVIYMSAAFSVFVAMSTRLQLFYGVYFLPPLLIGVFAVFDLDKRRDSLQSATRFLALFIILGFSLGSINALADWRSYVFIDNKSEHLCFSQQMDQLMVNTSVGTCKEFESEMKR